MNKNTTTETPQIFQRIRDRKGRAKGVLVARRTSRNRFVIGWSLCDNKDTFDLNHGILVAVGRAETNDKTPMPHTVAKDMPRFQNRATRYFMKNLVTLK